MAAAHAAGSVDRRRLMHLMKCTRQLSGPEDVAEAEVGAGAGAGVGVETKLELESELAPQSELESHTQTARGSV